MLQEVWLVPAAGGAPRRMSQDPPGVFSGDAVFAPDGRGIVDHLQPRRSDESLADASGRQRACAPDIGHRSRCLAKRFAIGRDHLCQ